VKNLGGIHYAYSRLFAFLNPFRNIFEVLFKLIDFRLHFLFTSLQKRLLRIEFIAEKPSHD
jgi:hypothetical protein